MNASSRLDRLLMRTYERVGPRAIWVLGAVALGNAIFAVLVMGVAGSAYVDGTLKDISVIAAVAVGLGAVAIGTVVFSLGRRVTPVFTWTSTRSAENAAAAWIAANRGIDRALATGVALFSVLYVVLALVARSVMELPPSNTPVIYVYFEIGVAFAATLDYFAFHRLLRPLVADIASYLPAGFEPEYATPSLRVRLVLIMTTVSALVGVLAASNGSSPIEVRMATGIGVATAVMLAVGVAPALLLAEDVSQPLRLLMRATRRVELGDLSARVPVLAADEGGALARSFNRMVRGLEERELLRGAMGSYVDTAIAERVLAEGESLAGEEVEVSVMFVDIRDFTKWCEGHTANETVNRLNEFFGLIVPCVAANGGHTNKFLGDGLLAAFGAPEPASDHADRAVRCAREIAALIADRYGDDLRVGIGINSGWVVVGSVGGGGRLEFGLIGDVVNVAARVEQLTKETGDVILIAETTTKRLTDEVGLVPRGAAALRGKSEQCHVFAVG